MGDGAPKESSIANTKRYPDFIKLSFIKTEPYLSPHESSDEYLSRNWKKLGTLLGKIKENPQILSKMPPLPLSGDENTVLGREIEQRKEAESIGVDFNIDNEIVSKWMKANEIDQELLDFKFDISSKRYSKINKDLIGTPPNYSIDTPNPIFEAISRYHFDADSSQMSLRKLLETIRPLVVGQEYLDKHSQVAIEVIKKVNPEFLPKKPIEFVYMPDLGGKGMYLGEVGGKHYIACNPRFDLNPYMDSSVNLHQYPDQHDISSEVHEIFHASSAENIGMDNFFALKTNFDDMDPSIIGDGPYDTAKNLLKAIMDKNNTVAKDPTMAINILEGLAYTGQIMVLNSQIESFPDPVQKNILEKIKTTLWNELKYINETGKPFDSVEIDLFKRYREGVDYINKIKNVYGIEKVFDILMKIDYKTLSSYEENSPEILEIKKDPTKLPMRAIV